MSFDDLDVFDKAVFSGIGAAAGAFSTGLESGLIKEGENGELSLGNLSDGLKIDMNAEGGLEQLFEVLGLNGHPKAEEAKVYVRALLSSIEMPIQYNPHVLVGQYVTEASTCSQIQKCIENEAMGCIREHYRSSKFEYEQEFMKSMKMYLQDVNNDIRKIEKSKNDAVELEEEEQEAEEQAIPLSSYIDLLKDGNNGGLVHPLFFPKYHLN